MHPHGAAGARRRSHVLPVIVLAVALLLTSVGGVLAWEYVVERSESRFTSEAAELEVRIRDRMSVYESVLLGARAFMLASEDVTRDEWRTYVGSLELEARFPGLQGVGYAIHVYPDEIPALEERVRAEGFPEFQVTPTGPREEATPILFLEPFRGRNLRAFGYDMFSDPTRRAAMEEARDGDKTALTGRVRLVQETHTDVQAGFLMYVPLYDPDMPQASVAERREALLGYVYSPFRANDFAEGIIQEARPEVEFEIYDGTTPSPDTLLYDSDASSTIDAEDGRPTQTQIIRVSGHEWTLVTRATADLEPPLEALPVVVVLGGALSSALLFAIAWGLVTTQRRALAIADEMTRELRERTADLQASNEALQAFSYVVSHDLKEPVRGVDVYLRALREDHEDTMHPEARDLARRAHEANERLSVLLQSLLSLSRVNRASLTTRPVTLAEVMETDECRIAFERLAAERGARVEVEPGPTVLAAPSVLAQALGNLVANAIVHGGDGPRHVRVRSTREPDGVVACAVEDDGRGFPTGFTERFNQGGREGIQGFGLLIAQRAVERLGGRFWLGTSAELGGSAVRFTLPAAD